MTGQRSGGRVDDGADPHADPHADLLPIDPDVDPEPMSARAPAGRRATRRSAWPRLRLDVVLAVFAGGCVGGAARYGVTSAWPTPAGTFPWSTFTVNVAGALVLAVIVVAAAELVPSRYLRPVLGTGFCGALTTFSSVVVTTDQLFGRHPGLALAYLLGTAAAGLAAGALGLAAARAVVRRRSERAGGSR